MVGKSLCFGVVTKEQLHFLNNNPFNVKCDNSFASNICFDEKFYSSGDVLIFLIIF